jgi:folate-dependent phosphoribosylglycinamide formyltransferase PurN
LGVLASGSGSNFEALVEACRAHALPAEVALLVVQSARLMVVVLAVKQLAVRVALE